MSQVRVIAPRIGGGFGGKCEFTNQPITAFLAQSTGKPVKMTLSREDDMSMMKSRHGGKIYMKTGASKDGTLLARDCRIILDGGAYADEKPRSLTHSCVLQSRTLPDPEYARGSLVGLYQP